MNFAHLRTDSQLSAEDIENLISRFEKDCPDIVPQGTIYVCGNLTLVEVPRYVFGGYYTDYVIYHNGVPVETVSGRAVLPE